MQLKRIFTALMVAVLIITASVFTVSAEDSENEFEFAVEVNSTVNSGETINVDAEDTLDINLTAIKNPGVARFSIVIEYDADALILVTDEDEEVVYETALFDFYDDNFNKETVDFSVPGKIKISTDLFNKTFVNETGDFISFSFNVAPEFHGETAITVKTANIADGISAKYIKNTALCAHTYADPVVVDPTCDTEGKTTEKCTVCDFEHVIETKPAKGHTPVAIPAVEATADKAGSTAGEKCSVCDKILVQPEVIPAKGVVTTPVEPQPEASLLWLWIVLGVAVVAGAGVAVYFFVIKKKK